MLSSREKAWSAREVEYTIQNKSLESKNRELLDQVQYLNGEIVIQNELRVSMANASNKKKESESKGESKSESESKGESESDRRTVEQVHADLTELTASRLTAELTASRSCIGSLESELSLLRLALGMRVKGSSTYVQRATQTDDPAEHTAKSEVKAAPSAAQSEAEALEVRWRHVLANSQVIQTIPVIPVECADSASQCDSQQCDVQIEQSRTEAHRTEDEQNRSTRTTADIDVEGASSDEHESRMQYVCQSAADIPKEILSAGIVQGSSKPHSTAEAQSRSDAGSCSGSGPNTALKPTEIQVLVHYFC